jgi:hypothetical protein
MSYNVGPWTEKYYGKRLTPEEFLNNPEAQDKVFDGEFYRLADRYGWEGAAQAWLGGEGSVGQAKTADPLGTKVGPYGQGFLTKFNQYLKGGGGGTAAAAPSAPASTSAAPAPAPTGAGASGTDANGYLVRDGVRYNDANIPVDENGEPVDANDPAAQAEPVDVSDASDTGAAMTDQAGRTVASIGRPVIPVATPDQFTGATGVPAQAPSSMVASASSQPSQQPTQIASATPPRSSLGVSKVADQTLRDDELARQQAIQRGALFARSGGVIPQYAGGGVVDANNDGIPDYLQPENQDVDYNAPAPRDISAVAANRADARAAAGRRAAGVPTRTKDDISLPARDDRPSPYGSQTQGPAELRARQGRTKDDTLPPTLPVPDTRPSPYGSQTTGPAELRARQGRTKDDYIPPAPDTRPSPYGSQTKGPAELRARQGRTKDDYIPPAPPAPDTRPSPYGSQTEPPRELAGGPTRTKDDAVIPDYQQGRQRLDIPPLATSNAPDPSDPAVAQQPDYDPMRAWSRGNADSQTVQKPQQQPRPIREAPQAVPVASQGNDLTNAGGVDPTTGEPLPDLRPQQPAPEPEPAIPVQNPPVPYDRPVQNAPIPMQRPTQAAPNVPTPTPRPTPPAPRATAIGKPQHKPQHIQHTQHNPAAPQPRPVPPNPWSNESPRVYHQVAPVGGRYEDGGVIPHYDDGGVVATPDQSDSGHTGIRWFWDQLFEPPPSKAPASDTQPVDWRTGEQTTAHYATGTPYQNVMPNVPLPPDKKPAPAQAAPLKHVPVPLDKPTQPAPQAAPIRRQAGVLPVINESDRVYHQVAPDRSGQYTDVINSRAYHAGPQRRAIFQQATGGTVPDDDDQRRMLNAGSQSPRIYEGSTAQQVAQSRPAQPQYTDNAPAPAPGRQGMPEPVDTPPPQPVAYSGAEPGHANPAMLGVAQVGIHHGLNFLSHIFGFDQQGVITDQAQAASQKAGVRRFMDGDGAATPQDNASIDASAGVNPDQSDAGKVLERMAKLTQVYLANGKKKEAGAAAASQLQYAANQFGNLGHLAQASYTEYLKTGDPDALKHTLDFMSKAHEYVPDGATFGVYVDPDTHKISATRTDVDGNEEHYAITPNELPGIISGITDKSSYWQQIQELADPAAARARANRADVDRRFQITQAGVAKRFNENQAGINKRFETGRQDRKEATTQRQDVAGAKIPNWDQISPVMNEAQATQKAVTDAGGDKSAGPDLIRKRDEAASALQDAIPNSYTYKTKFLQETDGIAPMGTYTYIPANQRSGAVAPAPATGPSGGGGGTPAAVAPAAASPSGGGGGGARKPPPRPSNVPSNAFFDYGSGNWIENQDGKMVVVG